MFTHTKSQKANRYYDTLRKEHKISTWYQYFNEDNIPFYHSNLSNISVWEQPINCIIINTQSNSYKHNNPHERKPAPPRLPYTGTIPTIITLESIISNNATIKHSLEKEYNQET